MYRIFNIQLNIGQSLVKMGEIEEKIGGIQTEFVSNITVNDNRLETMQVKNTRQTLVAEFEQFMVDVKTYKVRKLHNLS